MSESVEQTGQRIIGFLLHHLPRDDSLRTLIAVWIAARNNVTAKEKYAYTYEEELNEAEKALNEAEKALCEALNACIEEGKRVE
jgi:hypothetical protein